jgi:hypothetical protein
MDTTVKTTPMPIIAGVLAIISGVCGLFVVLGLVIATAVVGGALTFIRDIPGMVPWVIPGVIESILLSVAIPLALVSILALIGGIYALLRRMWGLALAGSIAAILASIPLLGGLPLGIAATILVALSRDEFA